MLRVRIGIRAIYALRALLVVMGVLALAMWNRSYGVEDRFLARSGQDEWGLRSRWGLVFIELPAVPSAVVGAPFRYDSVSIWRSYSPLIDQEREWDLLVVACYRTIPARYLRPGTTFFLVPYWVFVVSFFAYPAIVAMRTMAGHRHREPLVCANCGYDLRATPDRCPECGAATGNGS
jgi:hypothetical protein